MIPHLWWVTFTTYQTNVELTLEVGFIVGVSPLVKDPPSAPLNERLLGSELRTLSGEIIAIRETPDEVKKKLRHALGDVVGL